MVDARTRENPLSILIGAAVMLTIGMGIRQCFGLFVQPLTRDIALTVSEFTLALSVQNLTWGFLQPVAGAVAVRLGFRPILLGGSGLYLAGLALLASADGLLGVIIGAGLLIGLSLACTGSAMALAVASRVVSARRRSLILGLVTGAGSLGALLAAPLGQSITQELGWRFGVLALLALALIMLPASWLAGRADWIGLPAAGEAGGEKTAAVAVCAALGHLPFLVMAGAPFLCGHVSLFFSPHIPP